MTFWSVGSVLSLALLFRQISSLTRFLQISQKSSSLDVRFNHQNSLNSTSAVAPSQIPLGELTKLPQTRIHRGCYTPETGGKDEIRRYPLPLLLQSDVYCPFHTLPGTGCNLHCSAYIDDSAFFLPHAMVKWLSRQTNVRTATMKKGKINNYDSSILHARVYICQ